MSQARAQRVAAPPAMDMRPRVEALLGPVLVAMGYPARLDFTTLADGALGVAVHFEGPPPSDAARGGVMDSLQFLLNKAVNRPNLPRQWVNLGINTFPEPRGPRPVTPPPSPSLSCPRSGWAWARASPSGP